MKRHAAKTAAGAAVLIIALLSLVVIAAEYAAPPIKLVPAEETLKRAKGNLPKMIQTEDSAKALKISKMLQTAKYESFDFHPAVDGMKLTRHPKRESGGEWYGNVEGVDTTCALLIGERALVEIARELGREDIVRSLEATIARYGVQDDYRTIRIPEGARGRKLKIGKLELNYPADDSVELRTAFERRFKVIVPAGAGSVTVTADGTPLPSGDLNFAHSGVSFTAFPGKTYQVSRRARPCPGP